MKTHTTSAVLIRLEKIIAKAQRLRLSEAKALRTIRDKRRLYRKTHDTFESYCQERWGFSRQHAQRLCDFADVCENLSTIGDIPQIETHARPLVCLTDTQQRKAWKIVSQQGERVTASAVEAVAKAVQCSPSSSSVVSLPVKVHGRPPIRYFGQKTKLASKIIALFPAHKLYVEPFSGSAAVLFGKSPSEIEIYNDLDGDIVHFFRTLRTSGKALYEALRLTPYARDEHALAKAQPHDGDDVERARRFFIRCRQSYNGIIDDTWRLSVKRSPSDDNASSVALIESAGERLAGVQIENRDFRKLLKAIPDENETLIYADPPYVLSARSRCGVAYKHEMSADDHCDLLDILTGYKRATVILSGYRTKLYDQRLKGGKRYDHKGPVCVPNARSHDKPVIRIESIWKNN